MFQHSNTKHCPLKFWTPFFNGEFQKKLESQLYDPKKQVSRFLWNVFIMKQSFIMDFLEIPK